MHQQQSRTVHLKDTNCCNSDIWWGFCLQVVGIYCKCSYKIKKLKGNFWSCRWKNVCKFYHKVFNLIIVLQHILFWQLKSAGHRLSMIWNKTTPFILRNAEKNEMFSLIHCSVAAVRCRVDSLMYPTRSQPPYMYPTNVFQCNIWWCLFLSKCGFVGYKQRC